MAKAKLLNAIITGFLKAAKALHQNPPAISAPNFEAIATLAYAAIAAAEKERGERPSAGALKKTKSDLVEWTHLKISAAEAVKIAATAAQILPKFYQTHTDLEHLVGLLVKTAHLLVENAENCRIGQLRGACLEALAICGTKLSYRNGLQIIIVQDLSYLEHLAEFNAELLARMSLGHEDSTIMDSILQHLGGVTFSTDDLTASKIICAFLVKLTIVDAQGVLRSISTVAELIDSEVYSVRMSMLEVFAVLYCHLMLQNERDEQTRTQARFFLGAIEERLRDVNSFVRCKVLLVLGELVQANALPVSERGRLIDLAAGRVMDKSSNVRRRAIQTLGEFLRRHPFCVDGGELSLKFFQERLDDIDQQLSQLEGPSEVKTSMSGSLDALTEVEEPASPDGAQVAAMTEIDLQRAQTLLMQKRYYSDAITFVRQLDRVMPSLCQLLSSSTKTEVFEVMDFFVDAHIYKLHSSEAGIRKMMHLIWEQDLSTEDGTKRSVKEHLLANYRKVYLEVDSRVAGRDRILEIARNLLHLVRGSSVGDLASLEQVMAGFMRKDWIPEAVIQALTAVFAGKHSALADQRAAIILLSMIGRHSPETIASRLETIVKVGLGPAGLTDPWIAEYSLLSLSLLAPSEEVQQSGSKGQGGSLAGKTNASSSTALRLRSDNPLLSRIANLIRVVPISARWLQVIPQAIRAIYQLADQPNVFCTELIRELAQNLGGEMDTSCMVRLLFIVGHVAVAANGHLDDIEKQWKQRRAAQSAPNDMHGVTATEDEDICEAIRQIRENELLYGNGRSLLSVFGPVLVTICSNLSAYPQRLLQNVAVMSLAKFMTVSGRFCDEQLPLFLTILEKCPDATIRGNLTIAFADLAQSFGRIVDSNIIYLFRRLKDPDVQVRRNALLVLTHLTLTGLIKIKGQVGEIARCILDADERVAGLARMFFHEMAGRDNAIYNHIPDIISSLSLAEEGAELGEADFGTIARFIFDYIKKERQMEGLVEKLSQRFRQTATPRQARDLACCLTLVNYTSERTIRRLVEAFPLYKDKLVDSVTFGYFAEVLGKMRRGGGKGETKGLLDEFEQKLVRAAGESGIEGSVGGGARMLAEQDETKKPKARRGRPSGRSKPVDSTDDEDAAEEEDADPMDIASGEEDQQRQQPSTKKAPPAAGRRRPPARSRRIVMRDSPSDNDDDEDIF